MTLQIDDRGRVRTPTLDRPEALPAGIAAARERANAALAEPGGGPADLEALDAFAEGCEPDLTSLPPG